MSDCENYSMEAVGNHEPNACETVDDERDVGTTSVRVALPK